MSVSACRRSRFYVHGTWSAVRCPFVPSPDHFLLSAGRGRSAIEVLDGFLHVGTDYVGFQHRRHMEATADMDGITRELRFDNWPVSPYAQDLRNYIIPPFWSFPLSPACCFPLWVSPLSEAVVLKVIALNLSYLW